MKKEATENKEQKVVSKPKKVLIQRKKKEKKIF